MRPTAQKVRDALFNSLGARVIGAEVLDLYAGTGALGLEALARGARAAVFVERDPRLAESIRKRVQALGFHDRAEVWRAEVHPALRRLSDAHRQFDLILLDPPYDREMLQATLDALAAAPLLRAGTLIVAEGHWRETPRAPEGLVVARESRYGETGLWVFAIRSGEPRETRTDIEEERSRDDGDLPGQFRSRP